MFVDIVMKSFRENADTSVDYPMQGISILDNLLHWEESKLQLNFREIGFPLAIVLSGSGTRCIQGNTLVQVQKYLL
jgi:hypothetical protein